MYRMYGTPRAQDAQERGARPKIWFLKPDPLVEMRNP